MLAAWPPEDGAGAWEQPWGHSAPAAHPALGGCASTCGPRPHTSALCPGKEGQTLLWVGTLGKLHRPAPH